MRQLFIDKHYDWITESDVDFMDGNVLTCRRLFLQVTTLVFFDCRRNCLFTCQAQLVEQHCGLLSVATK